MGRSGWSRRLDDRFDWLLRRGFGFGLTGGPEPSLRKQVVMALVASSLVALLLLIAMLATGQADRTPILIGPILGVTLGALLHVLRGHRKRRRS